MRPDVLELIAETLTERAAPVLASFTAFDGAGRPRVEGMQVGRPWAIDRGSAMNETEFRHADRLAQISTRQMARLGKETPMETHVGSNGVSSGAHRKPRERQRYTDEFKADMVARFAAAPSKKDFAKEVGLNPAMLQRWRNEVSSGTAEIPSQPPPSRARGARAAALAGRELDVLRQLLELPADARDRILRALAILGGG